MSADAQDELQQLRAQMAVRERSRALGKRLEQDWTAFIQRRSKGEQTASTPLEELRIEAMATILALAEFHCVMAGDLTDSGADESAHAWTLDEGVLRSCFFLLSQIDTQTITL